MATISGLDTSPNPSSQPNGQGASTSPVSFLLDPFLLDQREIEVLLDVYSQNDRDVLNRYLRNSGIEKLLEAASRFVNPHLPQPIEPTELLKAALKIYQKPVQPSAYPDEAIFIYRAKGDENAPIEGMCWFKVSNQPDQTHTPPKPYTLLAVPDGTPLYKLAAGADPAVQEALQKAVEETAQAFLGLNPDAEPELEPESAPTPKVKLRTRAKEKIKGLFKWAAGPITRRREAAQLEVEKDKSLWVDAMGFYGFAPDKYNITTSGKTVKIALDEEQEINATRKSISYNKKAEENDDLIRVGFETLQKRGQRYAELTGSLEFKTKAWVHAKMMGINIVGFALNPADIDALKFSFKNNAGDELDPNLQVDLNKWFKSKLKGKEVDDLPADLLLDLRITVSKGAPAAATPQPQSARTRFPRNICTRSAPQGTPSRPENPTQSNPWAVEQTSDPAPAG